MRGPKVRWALEKRQQRARERIGWLGVVAAFAAAVSSGAAAYAGWQAMQATEGGTRPYLYVGTTQNPRSIYILNAGVGPAIVQDIEIRKADNGATLWRSPGLFDVLYGPWPEGTSEGDIDWAYQLVAAIRLLRSPFPSEFADGPLPRVLFDHSFPRKGTVIAAGEKIVLAKINNQDEAIAEAASMGNPELSEGMKEWAREPYLTEAYVTVKYESGSGNTCIQLDGSNNESTRC